MSYDAVNNVLNLQGISSVKRSLLLRIAMADNPKNGGSWPSLRTLAAYADISRRYAMNQISELESDGYIKPKRSPGRSNFYELLPKVTEAKSKSKLVNRVHQSKGQPVSSSSPVPVSSSSPVDNPQPVSSSSSELVNYTTLESCKKSCNGEALTVTKERAVSFALREARAERSARSGSSSSVRMTRSAEEARAKRESSRKARSVEATRPAKRSAGKTSSKKARKKKHASIEFIRQLQGGKLYPPAAYESRIIELLRDDFDRVEVERKHRAYFAAHPDASKLDLKWLFEWLDPIVQQRSLEETQIAKRDAVPLSDCKKCEGRGYTGDNINEPIRECDECGGVWPQTIEAERVQQ